MRKELSKFWINLVSWLLNAANRERGWVYQNEFYELKSWLVQRYGTFKEYQIQHITNKCFECAGTGRLWMANGFGKCPDCYGTGVYKEFWSVLKLYKMGRYEFHLPRGKYDSIQEMRADGWLLTNRKYIQGRIQHKPCRYYLGKEAFWWLMLIYRRNFFFSHFGRVGYLSKKFTPMVVLCTWLFWHRQNVIYWKAKLLRVSSASWRMNQV